MEHFVLAFDSTNLFESIRYYIECNANKHSFRLFNIKLHEAILKFRIAGF